MFGKLLDQLFDCRRIDRAEFGSGVVNGRIVARGEVVVVDEDTSRFGVSLTEIVGSTDADAFA